MVDRLENNQTSARITELRENIDKLDEQISRLLLRRLEIAVELGNLKCEAGLPMKDAHREEDVLERVSTVLSESPLSGRVLKLYERILQECCAAQNT